MLTGPNNSNPKPVQAALDTPVLLLVFNRPDTTRRVFAAIRAARPTRLYVAADGPRTDHGTDSERVARVREIATAVDWDCEVKTLFQARNLGCGEAPSRGISWFFQNEEMGIVLEDDCLPHPDFWRFCDELLPRYRQDHRVMGISGINRGRRQTAYSYHFSRHYNFWGWATWARAWRHFDYDMQLWPIVKEEDLLRNLCVAEETGVAEVWKRRFDQVSQGLIDAWDYQWVFSCWLHNGLQIIPATNLVSNIGFNDEATHTTDRNDTFAALSVNPLAFPLKHPPVVVRDIRADERYAREWVVPSLPKRAVKRIKRISDQVFSAVAPAKKSALGKL